MFYEMFDPLIEDMKKSIEKFKLEIETLENKNA